MSKTKFNLSEKEMDGDSKFNKTGNSFSNADSLKGKLLDLEQRILQVAGIFNEENNKIQDVGDNKDELEELLKQKNKLNIINFLNHIIYFYYFVLFIFLKQLYSIL